MFICDNYNLSWNILRQIFDFILSQSCWCQLINVWILSGTWFSSDAQWYSFRVQRRERGAGLQTDVLHPLFVYHRQSQVEPVTSVHPDMPNDRTEKEVEHREATIIDQASGGSRPVLIGGPGWGRLFCERGTYNSGKKDKSLIQTRDKWDWNYCLQLQHFLLSDCIPSLNTNTMVRFADDMTVVWPITKGDESACRRRNRGWLSGAQRTISHSTPKTNKNKQNYSLWTSGRSRMSTHHWTISGERAERVASFKFLSTHISEDLTWTADTTALVKKAQPRLYFLLKKVNLSQQLLGSFYRCSTESILTYGIPAWYGGSSAADKKSPCRGSLTLPRTS